MAAEANTLLNAHAKAEPEDEARDHLLLDPKPREEMNGLVMEAMHSQSRRYKVLTTLFGIGAATLLFGVWAYMIAVGIGVTGKRRPMYWVTFITTFVFWIGISHAGTFVSALLRVFKAEFRRPFTRAAELMTTFGLAAGVLFPLIHLGRVWVFYWMIPYPNSRWLWPNFHSPLVWDFLAITTYLLSSTIYLFLPLMPDLAMARDRSKGWRHAVYRVLALGWRGTEAEWHRLKVAINIFAFAIIPVMFSVHTIVSWDFAVAQTVGWSSTIFGPYFIVGAILSGVAAVITILYFVRQMKNMKYFIRLEHFDSLGKLLLVISMGWAYFYFNEYILHWYGGEQALRDLLTFHAKGPTAWVWYVMLICNVGIPWLTLWNKKIRRTPWAMLLITLGINVGMYLERLSIIPLTLEHQRDPFNWGVWNVTFVDVAIPIGTLCLFIFLYLVASRLIPLVPVWEVQEGQQAHRLRQVGKAKVKSVADLD